MDKIIIKSKIKPQFEIHVFENGSYFTNNSKLVENPGKSIPKNVLIELYQHESVKNKRQNRQARMLAGLI